MLVKTPLTPSRWQADRPWNAYRTSNCLEIGTHREGAFQIRRTSILILNATLRKGTDLFLKVLFQLFWVILLWRPHSTLWEEGVRDYRFPQYADKMNKISWFLPVKMGKGGKENSRTIVDVILVSTLHPFLLYNPNKVHAEWSHQLLNLTSNCSARSHVNRTGGSKASSLCWCPRATRDTQESR